MFWNERFDRLDKLVEKMREKHADVPKFSCNDAGERARVLFVFQTPNDVAVERGYCEIENEDPSANAVRDALTKAQLHRRMTASWNVVPWRYKDPPNALVRESLPWLEDVVKLMPALAAVVLCGSSAQLATPMLYRELPTSVAVLHAPHPSRRGLLRQGKREHFFDAVRRARFLAYDGASGNYAAEVAENPEMDEGWKALSEEIRRDREKGEKP